MERINNTKAKITVELVREIELKKIMYGRNKLTAGERKIWDRWEHVETIDGTMGLQKRIKFEAMSREENQKRQKMGLAPRVLKPNGALEG